MNEDTLGNFGWFLLLVSMAAGILGTVGVLSFGLPHAEIVMIAVGMSLYLLSFHFYKKYKTVVTNQN